MALDTTKLTPGKAADMLYKLKDRISEAKQKVDELDSERKELEAWLIDNLPKTDTTGVSGKLATVRVVTKVKPTVTDWDAFYKHISRTKSWEFLQKRLGEKAIQERWDAGKVIPGVGEYNAVTISLTKVK